MKSRFSQSIVFALLVATVVVVCFNTWLAFRAVEDLSESQRWVSHSWHVIDSLEKVINALRDAETSTQGFLLTGDPVYFPQYARAKNELPGDLATVAHLVVDNSAEEKAQRELQALIEGRISLLDQSIEERRAGNASSLHLQVLTATGLAEMNHVRDVLARMHDTELHLRARRVEAWRRDSWRAEATVLFASVVDFLLLLLMFRYLVVERRLLRLSDETTDHLQRLQSISDVALTHLTASELTVELLSRAGKVISADAVLLCTRSEGGFRVQAASGMELPPGQVVESAKEGRLAQAIEEDRVIMEPDTSLNPVALEPLRRNTRSLLIAPLSAAKSVGGVLIAGRQVARPFSRQDGDMLSVVAHRIAMTLDRANAYEAERKARQEAEARAREVRMLNAELEERVRLRTAELEVTNQELEAFSYSVSHDLRAPLRTIDGFSLAFEEDFGKGVDPRGLDYLRRIREGVQRMGLLIDSLLQLSRITRVPLTRERIDLSATAQAIAHELADHNAGRTIHFQIAPGLECMGDSRLLRAALENLLGNAVKFTARELEAEIELGRADGAYFLRDNGAGFDMRYADQLFHAFNRLHGDREFRGSGIGLATVARIIRRHQGKIWAEGVVGQGATFWFTLEPAIQQLTRILGTTQTYDR